ncbi:hypothetical protein [Cylindrospermum stagnale]|uniref:hypothetical protein n=1 Tax=Cylindrospermum stagnale TaxID=142864 RepID=UPI0002F10284
MALTTSTTLPLTTQPQYLHLSKVVSAKKITSRLLQLKNHSWQCLFVGIAFL